MHCENKWLKTCIQHKKALWTVTAPCSQTLTQISNLPKCNFVILSPDLHQMTVVPNSAPGTTTTKTTCSTSSQNCKAWRLISLNMQKFIVMEFIAWELYESYLDCFSHEKPKDFYNICKWKLLKCPWLWPLTLVLDFGPCLAHWAIKIVSKIMSLRIFV